MYFFPLNYAHGNVQWFNMVLMVFVLGTLFLILVYCVSYFSYFLDEMPQKKNSLKK